MPYQVALTPKSGNVKTGPIPVSTTTKSTCPPTCGVRDVCYADSGPLAIHWRKVTDGTRGDDWSTFCAKIKALPDGTLWRHNQAGDLPGDGKRIDLIALGELVKANKGKRGFTYTHYSVDDIVNYTLLLGANDGGFTINISCEEEKDAVYYAKGKLPSVCVVPYDETRKKWKADGVQFVICPATYNDEVSCMTCKLCAVRDRKSVVAFPAHGRSKKRFNPIKETNNG